MPAVQQRGVYSGSALHTESGALGKGSGGRIVPLGPSGFCQVRTQRTFSGWLQGPRSPSWSRDGSLTRHLTLRPRSWFSQPLGWERQALALYKPPVLRLSVCAAQQHTWTKAGTTASCLGKLLRGEGSLFHQTYRENMTTMWGAKQVNCGNQRQHGYPKSHYAPHNIDAVCQLHLQRWRIWDHFHLVSSPVGSG